jgi:hypothetical protein
MVGPHFSRVRNLPFEPVMAPFEHLMRLDEFMELSIPNSELRVPGTDIRIDRIEFDLNFTKKKAHIQNDYVFTRRRHEVPSPSHALDASLGNPVLALMTGAQGAGLWLVPRDDFDETASAHTDDIDFRLHLPWASTALLFRQSCAAIYRAIGTRLGVRPTSR